MRTRQLDVPGTARKKGSLCLTKNEGNHHVCLAKSCFWVKTNMMLLHGGKKAVLVEVPLKATQFKFKCGYFIREVQKVTEKNQGSKLGMGELPIRGALYTLYHHGLCS